MNPLTCKSLAFLLATLQVVAAASSKAKKPKKSKGKSKLSIGVIIAIVVVVIILLIVGVAIFCICKCLRKRRKSSFPLKTQGVPNFVSGGKTADPEQVSFLHPTSADYSAPAPPPPSTQYDQASWRPDAPQPQYNSGQPPSTQYDQTSWNPDAPHPQYNSGPSFPAPYSPTRQ